MKLVLSAIGVALVGIGLYVGYQKMPVINQLSQCYQAAVVAVDDKHIFSRRAHTTEATICEQRKTGLVEALNCFEAVERSYGGSEQERQWYKSMAKLVARSPQTIEAIVDEHNEECDFEGTQLRFDEIRRVWF